MPPPDDPSERDPALRDAESLIRALDAKLELLRRMSGDDVAPKIAEIEALLAEIRRGIKPIG